ncbi:MAG: ArnT family glycosyltransferase [Patescibacteria group bacterium]
MVEFLKKPDKFLKKHLFILFLLTSLFLLRIPNFFEPYWYGDEGIYLTIGNGMRHGLKLYSEIIDHKTPIIYYLAMVPNQFSFRILNLLWTSAFTIFFYLFCKKLFGGRKLAFFASLILVIFTSLPWFEGHLPNGELFVFGFVSFGLLLLSKTRYFDRFMHQDNCRLSDKQNLLALILAGFFAGLGILTKVPSLLDLGAFLVIGWFSFFNQVSGQTSLHKLKSSFKQIAKEMIIIAIGAAVPVLISIVYFIAIGSGKDYLDFGLLYNLRYSGSLKPEFTNPIFAIFFKLPIKVLILAGLMLLVTFGRKLLRPASQFATAWFLLAFFASLLSNRPYPHYFIQVIPSLALLLTALIREFYLVLRKSPHASVAKTIATGGVVAGVFGLFVSVLVLLRVGLYQVNSYYLSFAKLVTQQITYDQYMNAFNPYVEENHRVSKFIKQKNIQKIFIWGINPMLYAESQAVPTSRFTVSFHIKDFEAYEETFALVESQKPELIVVMRDEKTAFPQLENYLRIHYMPNYNFQHMVLYLRKK